MNTESQDAAFLRGLTLLYVEDDPEVREGLTQFLRRRTARVEIATNGEEGLAAFRELKPALVVTDIRMPVMDGLGMIQEIRALDPGVPIIVTTAFEQTDYMARAIELGVDRYVVKPVSADRLEAALLDCARGLRIEAELADKRRLELEVQRLQHEAALRVLTRGLAHDFNNLLQAILATLESASEKAQPGSPVALILGMGKRFTGIAQDLGRKLLLLAQPGDQVDREGSLAPLIEEVLKAGVSDTGIQVECRIPQDLPGVRYHQEHLGQALLTIITNAVEAMPQGGRLEFQATACTISSQDKAVPLSPGTYAHLSIKDSGRGIPPGDLTRVFDPYFSTKELGATKGQGLSLAISRATILAHGGGLTVESQVGSGTTFHVFLPSAVPSES